jgi:hypothetical protein
VRIKREETGSPNRSISAEDSGHYNLLALSQRTGVRPPPLATGLWPVELDWFLVLETAHRAVATGSDCKKSARENFAGAWSLYQENNFVATASL